MARATGSEMTTEQAKAEGLDRVALDRHLDRLALSQIAKEMNLTISPPQVVEALRPVRGVVDSAGKLVPGAIAQLAQSNNLSEADFVAIIQSDLVREQLLRSVAGGVGMPIGLQRALDLFRLERRIAQYLIVDPSRAGDVSAPDDKALKAYFDENALQRYAIPEHRSVAFIALRPDGVAKAINVPDTDIAKLYEANRKRYEVAEKRVFDQIRFKSEADAKAGQARLAAGETFEAVAKSQGFKPEDIAIGEISRGDKSVPDEAFDVAEGKTTKALKNSFGLWVILRANSVTPGTTRTLAEATDEIRKAILDTKVKEEIFELANQLEDMIGEGATLEEAAQRLKLKLESAVITREGDTLAGDPVTSLPAGNFLRQAFDAEQGNDPELQQTPEGVYYMFRVDKVTPVTKKDFAAVKADVVRDWTDAEISRRLDAVAADILKRARAGEKLETIASSQGLALVTSDPLPRFGKTAVFGEATVTTAAETKKGDFFSGPVAFGKGLVVGRVTEIRFEDEPADSPLKSAYGQRLLQVFVSDFVEQFEAGARAQVGSEIDEKRFQAFRNNE
jgi:peptidyl-prolyl cis-trans isomerase D